MIRSFRMHLQQTLGERCARNPRYSLRAFARQLAIDHSTLSQLLRGTRAISASTIVRIGTRLGMDRHVIETFVEQERQYPSQHSAKEIEMQRALLELVTLEIFRPDVGWIARVLGTTADAVNIALAQLLAMGALQMNDRNQWLVTKENPDGKRRRAMADSGERTRKG
jgi:plasmid maintenance system antidote protein VapI